MKAPKNGKETNPAYEMPLNNSGQDIGVIIPPGYSYRINEPSELDVGDFYSIFFRYGTMELFPTSGEASELEGKLPEKTVVMDGIRCWEYEGTPDIGDNHKAVGGFFGEHYPDHKFYRPGDTYNSIRRI